MGLLEGQAVLLKAHFDRQALMQVHQYLVSCHLGHSDLASQRASLLRLREALGGACQDEFVKSDMHPSKTQQHVRRALCGMGLWVEEEARCPRSGYSIDMLVREPSPSADAHGESAARATVEWAVEFDGPTHFLASRSPTGATLLKRRHLQLLGYRLVSVPFWEWAKVQGDKVSEETYLRSKLGASLVRC
jgi:hypothetical protein